MVKMRLSRLFRIAITSVILVNVSLATEPTEESGVKNLLAEYRLEVSPRYNGMAVAESRCYISTIDGRLMCLGGTDWEQRLQIIP